MLQALPPPDPPQAEIVITARALPDPESERAYSVETFGRTRLTDAPTMQLEEILKQVPGLQLFRRSDARSGHPTSQGVTLRALGGNASSRALLILDGVPQADPFGGWVNWPAYGPAALHQVRVIRGGGAVAHGPGALAGVITMRSSLGTGIDASAYAGSRDSLAGRLHLGTRAAGGLVSISAAGARGDGFIPVVEEDRGPVDRGADYEQANVRGQWLAPLSATVDLQASASGFIDERERGVPFTGNRTRGADASLRLVGGGDVQWSALAYGQWRELRSSFASVDDERTVARRVALQDEVPSEAYGASAELRPAIGDVELRIGGDTRLTRGETRELFFFIDGEPTRGRVAGGETVTVGPFAEISVPAGAMTFTAGGRLDYWRISDGKLQERELESRASLRDEAFPARQGWRPTARAGAVLDLGKGYALRSAAYLGWRMPTLNELFRPFRVGADATAANALLDPERLAGIEAGVDYRRDGLELSATVFANRLNEAIANVTLAQGPGLFPGVGFVGAAGEYRQRRNLDSIDVQGIEASAEGQRGPWSARAALSLVDAEVSAGGAAARLDGLRPAQTPRFAFTAGLGWERSGRALSLFLRHVASQFEDDRNDRSLPAATTIDAFAGWPVGRTVQLVLRGENLFDERVVAGISGGDVIERATPRTLWVGLRFSGPSAR